MIKYYRDYYVFGGENYICIATDETEDGEMEDYCELTINLSDYGIHAKEDEIIIPDYRFGETDPIIEKAKKELVEKIISIGCVGPFDAMYSIAKLVPDWKEKCELLEEA